MTNEQVLEKVKKIIVDRLGIDETNVQLTSSIQNDFGADSLDMVELIMEIEDEFGIEIPDDEAEKLTTVEEAITFIVSKMNK